MNETNGLAPAPEQKKATHISFPMNVLNELFKYLATKPYAEVKELINTLETTGLSVAIENKPAPAAQEKVENPS